MTAITATTPPIRMPNEPLLSFFMTVFQRLPPGRDSDQMLREFAEIVAEFGPFRGMHCATSAGQLCENGRTRYETGNHGRPQPQQGDMDTQPNAKSF